MAYLWRVGGVTLVRARAGYVLQLAAVVAVVGIIVMAVDHALDPDLALIRSSGAHGVSSRHEKRANAGQMLTGRAAGKERPLAA